MTSKSTRIQKLLTTYKENLLEQERILREGGSPTVGNRHAKAYLRAQQKLFEDFGDEGREAFSRMLYHDDPAIRGDAAAVLLRYKHAEALTVLQELAQANDLGLVCAGARATIGRWEDGTWELDPDPSQKG